MHRYRIYGVEVASNRALNGVTASEAPAGEPGLRVDWLGQRPSAAADASWQKVSTPELERRRSVNLWRADGPDGVRLHMQYDNRVGCMDFVIGPGARSVAIHWPADVAFSDVQSYFLGPVFACLLRRRGMLCLHAAVVTHGDAAIAIIGAKGAGKSTTSAALVSGAWRMLADDVAALRFAEDRILVAPGYPRMRLGAEVGAALFGDQRVLSKVYNHVDKRYCALDDGPGSADYCREPRPLAGVFFLGPRQACGQLRCTAITAREGLILLAKNTIGNYVVIEPEARARELEQMARLAREVPLRRLSVPEGVERLGAADAFLRQGLSDGEAQWLS